MSEKQQPLILTVKCKDGTLHSGTYVDTIKVASIYVQRLIDNDLEISIPLSEISWYSLGAQSHMEMKRQIHEEMKEQASQILREHIEQDQDEDGEFYDQPPQKSAEEIAELRHRVATSSNPKMHSSLRQIAEHQRTLEPTHLPHNDRIIQPGEEEEQDLRMQKARARSRSRSSIARDVDDSNDM